MAHKARQRQAAARVKRKRGTAGVKKKRKGKTTTGSGGHAPRRDCVRCEKRIDECRRRGCKKYAFSKINKFELNNFLNHRKKSPVRHFADFVDVVCISHTAKQALPLRGAACTLLGLSIHAHFNSMRTSGVLLPALWNFADATPASTAAVEWGAVLKAMRKCKETWGGPKGLGLYSPNNMSGCGFPAVPSGDKIDACLEGFKRLYACTFFKKSAAMLGQGIRSFADFDRLRRALQASAKANPGALGQYHLHMQFSLLVGMEWVKPLYVNWWSIAGDAGTITALRRIFGPELQGRNALNALRELWHRLAMAGELRQREHLGSLGAQLCFWKRSLIQSNARDGQSRFDETVRRRELDLEQLRAAGITIDGWHREGVEAT